MKHIKFTDSPVMRELERQAIKKGTFKFDEVEEIVKKASAKKSYAASGNLQNDLLKLASGLRDKGFAKEADALENKIFIRKNAETHLYRAIDEDADDVINFAHPDGDAKVSDATNQNGEVETILSQHKKMVDVANKQPTGKYSQINRNIILAASEALGLDLQKFAQDSTQELEAERSYELETSDATQDKVKTINASLTDSKSKSLESLQQAKDFLGLNEAWFNLDFKKLLSNPGSLDFFVKNAKVDAGRLTALLNAFRILFGSKDEIAPEDISNIIYKFNNYQGLYNYFKPYIGGLADTYFKGTKFTDLSGDAAREAPVKAQQDSRWMQNPSSIWTATMFAQDGKIDNTAVAAASNAIKNYFDTSKAELVDKNIPKVVGQAKRIVLGLSGDIDNAVNLLNGVPPVRRQVGIALGKLQETSQVLDKVGKETQDGKVNEVYDALGAGTATANVNNAIWEAGNSVKTAISVLSNNKLNAALDNPAPDALMNDMIKKFQTIGHTFDQYLKSGAKMNKQEQQNVESNREIASNVFSVLKDNKDKPFAMVLLNVHGTFPNVNSPQALNEIADKGLEMSAKYQVQAPQQADDGLSVRAQWAGTTPPKPGAAPAPQAGGAKPAANGKDRLAVKLMQDTLNSIGISLEGKGFDRNDLMKLRDTGQGPNVASGDGVWGSRTTTALETANKILNLTLKTTYNAATAGQDATNNSKALSAAYVSKANMPANKGGNLLDTIPSQINWDSDPAAASFSTFYGGSDTVQVTNADLSNLSSFYRFLTQNRLQEPETSGASDTNIGSEGFTIETWAKALQWFIKRAVVKYNDAKGVGQEALTSAKQYYDQVKNLQQQLKNSGAYKTIGTKEVIPAASLNQPFANPASANSKSNDGSSDQAGGQGSSYSQRRGGRGPTSGNDMDGTRTQVPNGKQDNSPPITDVVDLRRGEWFNMPYSTLDSPVLRLSDFQRVPGARMAQSMFAEGAMNNQAAQKQVLDFLGQTPLGWNKDMNSYVVQTPQGRMLAQNVPGFQEAMGQVTARSSTQQYQNFLNSLSKQLHDTFNAWSQDASANEQSAMKDYYNRWQQGIAKQYRDITQRREY